MYGKRHAESSHAESSADDASSTRRPAALRRVARRARSLVRSGADLVRDPAAWSARWYRDKDDMNLAALQPRTWRPVVEDDR